MARALQVFGTRPPLKAWLVKLPRIGVSYRKSDRLTAVRLTLGYHFGGAS